MKIIWTDNFDREIYPERVVAENVNSETYGMCMLDALRAKFSGDNSEAWFRLVPDEYKLRGGMNEAVEP